MKKERTAAANDEDRFVISNFAFHTCGDRVLSSRASSPGGGGKQRYSRVLVVDYVVGATRCDSRDLRLWRGGRRRRHLLCGVIDRVDDFICRKSTFESC